MLAALYNGVAVSPDQPVIHLDERGLLYGDGVFETMLLQNGQVRFIDDHLQRLRQGCEQLHILTPENKLLDDELAQLQQQHREGIIKLIITRGRGGRGYRPSVNQPTRILQLFASVVASTGGITVRWCETRWARNSLLAGIKHLNRLEQVMAQSEWNDPQIAEGLMLDTEDELISGTMSNVFMMIDDVLVTPDLRFCGVQGVMRKNVLRYARDMNILVEERAVRSEELRSATEVFVTNTVRGIQPVVTLLSLPMEVQQWPIGTITLRLMNKLSEH